MLKGTPQENVSHSADITDRKAFHQPRRIGIGNDKGGNAIWSISATFKALTISRREFGFCLDLV